MVSIARQFRVSESLTSEVIRETATAIWLALKGEYLPEINSEDQWKLIAKEFDNRWNFPNCLSALDGKHIVIEVRTEILNYCLIGSYGLLKDMQNVSCKILNCSLF